MKFSNLLILAAVLLASGCIGGGGNNDNSNSASTAVLCSQMELEILEGSGEEVQVINLGDSSFGNITITWNYENGGKLTREVPTPEAMERETYQSNNSGSFNHINVQHESCPSRSAIQY